MLLALPALLSIRASNKLHSSAKSTIAFRSSAVRLLNPGALANNHCMLISDLIVPIPPTSVRVAYLGPIKAILLGFQLLESDSNGAKIDVIHW